MTDAPTTWEEAAHLAAEKIEPISPTSRMTVTEWFDADLKNLRRIFAGEEMPTYATPAIYARSMAKRALHELSNGGVSFYERRGEILALIARKQHDYGHGNILAFGEKGVIVRLSDKVERYKNLLGRDLTQGLDESIEDTLVDIVGYAIILTMLEAGTFELPLAADKRGDVIDKVLDELLAAPAPVFLVSVDDVKRIVRDELKAYHDARFNAPYSSQGLAASTWARYAATAFGGQ